jgi:CRP/FNR family transcriptional regulator
VQLTGSGGREITLYRVGPGDVCLQTFACLTQGRTYGAEGIVETDIEGDLVPADGFAAAMQEPGFCAEVLAGVAKRFAEMERLVERMAFDGLDARLAATLLALADPAGRVEATHERLAVECGSAREAVSRKLKHFCDKGLLRTGRGFVQLDRPEALRRLAAEGAGRPV